jgi:hypothetical protein
MKYIEIWKLAENVQDYERVVIEQTEENLKKCHADFKCGLDKSVGKDDKGNKYLIIYDVPPLAWEYLDTPSDYLFYLETEVKTKCEVETGRKFTLLSIEEDDEVTFVLIENTNISDGYFNALTEMFPPDQFTDQNFIYKVVDNDVAYSHIAYFAQIKTPHVTTRICDKKFKLSELHDHYDFSDFIDKII